MLKKIILFMCPVLILTACSSIKSNKTVSTSSIQNTQTKQLTISDYFPFTKNSCYRFTASGTSENDSFIYTDYMNDKRVQLRTISNGTSTGYVFENESGELRLIDHRENFFYVDNLLDTQNNQPEIVLKEPLVKGNSWLLQDGSKRYISGEGVKVYTTLGEFFALEVTTDAKDGSKTIEYYAPNVGLIKKEIKSKSVNYVSSLASIQNDSKYTSTVNFYYPDVSNNKIYCIKKQLSFDTNENLIKVFQTNMSQGINKNIPGLISNEVKINKLYLNNSSHKAYIDFSSNLTNYIAHSSSEETLALKAIADTVCNYYKVDSAIITLDGKEYLSSYTELNPGESVFADLKCATEYK